MSRPKLNHTLLIFVKYPEPGGVKTRLAEDLGYEKAAEIYASMAESVIHNLSRSEEYKTVIFFDPPYRKREMENWLGKRYQLLAQEGNSLGERMANAFDKTFSLGAEKAVIIGTDCLEITEEIISRAFQSLDEMDVVLGPAEDGGYYLLGMKESTSEIFDDITWSSSQVLGQTINKIKTMGLKFSLLKTLRDIDTISDLNNGLLAKTRKSKND